MSIADATESALSGWIVTASVHHAVSVACRLSGILACVPLFRDGVMSLKLKFAILFVIAMSLIGTGAIDRPMDIPPLQLTAMTLASELLIGLVLGWFVLMIFGSVRGSCQLISAQIGVSGASMVDPLSSSKGQSDVLSRLYTSLAIVIFLSLDLHLVLIESLANSFREIPPGQLDLEAIPTLLSHLVFGTGPAVLIAAVSLALPALAAMLIVSMSQGVLGRMLPEAELLVLGIPMRILIGLVVLIVSLPYSVQLIEGLFERAIEDGNEAFRSAALSSRSR